MCSSCAADITEYVDFRLIRQECKEYGIPDNVLVDVMPRERGGRICLRPTVDETRQMLQKLGKIENGCQIFYRCLRQTEHNPNHKYVADKLLKRGKWNKDKYLIARRNG